MSLRVFHIVFVVTSILLAAGFGAWGIARFLDSGETSGLIAALAAFAIGGALAVYGKRFWRKMKGTLG